MIDYSRRRHWVTFLGVAGAALVLYGNVESAEFSYMFIQVGWMMLSLGWILFWWPEKSN